jgi:uncharacterized cofD-like protein
MKKKIVVFGGGNGSAAALVALKQNIEKFDVTAVVSMSDSGGSSGKLRQEFGVLPPGDIMRAILALSKYDYPILKRIFYSNRFSISGKLNKHNLGNIFLALSTEYCGDFLKAIEALSQSVEAMGKVLPNTLQTNDLVAELTNGQEIETEAAIDEPNYDRKLKISKVYLKPKVKAYSPVLSAIKQADYIIFSPGSLYTSLIAALLPSGILKTIEKSPAKLIFVVGNAFHPHGETGPEDVKEAIEVLQSYLPRKLNLVLHNDHQFTAAEKKKYQEKKWGVLKNNTNEIENIKVISFDYERVGGGLCSIKLGKKFKEVLK